jgi:hypothetical protein
MVFVTESIISYRIVLFINEPRMKEQSLFCKPIEHETVIFYWLLKNSPAFMEAGVLLLCSKHLPFILSYMISALTHPPSFLKSHFKTVLSMSRS